VADDLVKGITFPKSSKAVNTYPIAALAKSGNGDLAKAFVDLITAARAVRPRRRRVRQAVGP